MAEEFNRSVKNITGITSHYSFTSAIAAGIHFRVCAETVIVRSTCDKLYVMVRDTCTSIEKGSFLLIDPFTPYSVIPNPDENEQTYDLFSFRATTDPWGKASCFFFSKGTLKLTSDDSEYDRFAAVFTNIRDVVSKFPKDNDKPMFTDLLILHGYAELLAAEMISKLGWHEIPAPVFESWDIFEPSVTFITENLGTDLSLDEVSARSGLSTFYFSHKYKEIYGNTVMRDVNKLKLFKSVAMLIQSTASISEIAAACGFSSVATYCSVFKKFYTYSPLQMRRKKTILKKAQ